MIEDRRKIYIRADANPQIGIGHLMRCLSLADEANGRVTFVLADEEARELVVSRGFQTLVLHTDYRQMAEELPFWENADPDLIIVDSYYAAPSYLAALREKAKLLYFDDLASYAYPVDYLLNYNVYAQSLDYTGLYRNSGLPMPVLLLGPGYSPLRSMFRSVPPKNQREQVRDVLISTGGADTEHIALRFAQAEPTGFVFHLLLGSKNPDRASVRKLEGDRIVVHENVTDMRALLNGMDLAVSAAGSTLYELCACGVPTITYVVADNQIPGAAAFERLGLTDNLGDLRRCCDPARRILSAVQKLSENYSRRVEMGVKMQKLIDGNGANRIWSAIDTLLQC